MEIKGKLLEKKIIPFTKKDNTQGEKAQLVISYMSGQYENNLALVVWNEKPLTAVKNMPPNAEVTVKFDVKSRAWQDKWYTDAVAYDVVFDTPAVTPMNAKRFDMPETSGFGDGTLSDNEDLGLPF